MEKTYISRSPAPAESLVLHYRYSRKVVAIATIGLLVYAALEHLSSLDFRRSSPLSTAAVDIGTCAFGNFPRPDDPFHFLPCTASTVPPPLDSTDPLAVWNQVFDPDPSHWSWTTPRVQPAAHDAESEYEGRGIYLCGFLDVPLDYTNSDDDRVVRLAVTKLQVSGLAVLSASPSSSHNATTGPAAGSKSNRTIVIEPGGPGGSGTSYVWRAAESITQRLSGGQFDVLGWDPRGVNQSQPRAACFPTNAHRDRWSLLEGSYREVVGLPSRNYLESLDAANDALMRACWERLGDLGRFLGTASVARDMDRIRAAVGEEELTGYLVSYGTGIGQTYANMFPDRVGRVILDGTEYVRDHRELAGFGWTALDNATDAWRDGFLGECVHAGPEHCALARPKDGDAAVTLPTLEARMGRLIASIRARPLVGYSPSGGPSVLSYSRLVGAIYSALYSATTWPGIAQMLSDLEDGNTTLATQVLDLSAWQFDPSAPCPASPPLPSSSELFYLVVCADSYDAPGQDLDWWDGLWHNMTTKSWISGNSRFLGSFPCRHFGTYWPHPAEVYRGDLNHTLQHPVLLVAETYDPATPLRNGRRLLGEMGWNNARLIVHHGYGHSSKDTSACTDKLVKAYILEGALPDSLETDCYADEKPYLYGIGDGASSSSLGSYSGRHEPLTAWKAHLQEMEFLNPKLMS